MPALPGEKIRTLKNEGCGTQCKKEIPRGARNEIIFWGVIGREGVKERQVQAGTDAGATRRENLHP